MLNLDSSEAVPTVALSPVHVSQIRSMLLRLKAFYTQSYATDIDCINPSDRPVWEERLKRVIFLSEEDVADDPLLERLFPKVNRCASAAVRSQAELLRTVRDENRHSN
jgi:hypothetical protein